MKIEALLSLVIKGIKILSPLFMLSAIGWELGNIYATVTDVEISPNLRWIFWVERPALFIHIIEGIIGSYYASSQGKKAINYGIYTFFVGFVGLLELKTESIHSLE